MGAYDFMIVVTATIAIGAVTEIIIGIPRTQAILLSSAVMLAYSMLGGMWALTTTDIAQFFIKTVGIFLVLLPASLIRAGGLAEMHSHLPPEFFSITNIGSAKILSFVTLYFLGILIGQDGWQRVFTARSTQIARRGGLLVGIYCIAYAAAGAIIGAAGRVFSPPLPDADLAFATIVTAVLPVGLRGLVLAASLAAIMSTATACLLASSTVFLEDVWLTTRQSPGTGTITQTRAIAFVLGTLAAATACLTNGVLAALTVGYDLLVGALFVPVMAAILWRRGTPLAAKTSIVVSSTVVLVLLAWYGIESPVPLYGGLGASIALFVTLSVFKGLRAPLMDADQTR